MLSLEFSAFDLVLSVGVIVLIILFVATLLKLNPSNEEKKSPDEEVFEEKPESALHLRQPTLKKAPQRNQTFATEESQETTSFQNPVKAPKVAVNVTLEGSASEKIPEQTSPPGEVKELSKQPKLATFATRTPNNSAGKDCPHKFGYLSGLPKNRPIPKECFGCQRTVACLVRKKGK